MQSALDRSLIDWLGHLKSPPKTGCAHCSPRRGPVSPPLRLPSTAVGPDGTISLGGDGYVAVAPASTVNFALRTRPSSTP
jgi:hypothetical protein